MARKSVKQWLVEANGWQRLWFVATVLCVLYGTIIFPLTETNKGLAFRHERLWAVEKEMKNPICAVYMSGDFEKLTYPDYSTDGTTCYHIYSHRKYHDDHKAITESMYQQHFQSQEREMWLKLIAFGFFLSALLSSFVYGAGVVTFWIRSGFAKQK